MTRLSCWAVALGFRGLILALGGFLMLLYSALASADVAQGAAPAAVPGTETLRRAFSDQDDAAFREPSRVFLPETGFHFIGGNVATNGIDPTPMLHPACEVLDGGALLLAWEAGTYHATREDGTTATWQARSPREVSLAGAWELDFPAGWGAPASVRLDKLTSWTEMNLPPEARAFSGTATYSTEFTLTAPAPGSRVELDLGRVEVIASVRLNGQPVGTVWTPPYRLDITRLAKPGLNRLTVEVTSTWFDRLVYDAGLDKKARKTWTISGPAKDRRLVPSGLLGPVAVRIGQVMGNR